MKKYFLYLLSALAMTACTNDEISELSSPEECKSLVVDSFYVPYETALKYALEAIDNGSTTMTRVASPERRVASHYEYVANKMTRSANSDVDVRFHVINFEDNQGFALVSADSRTTPVYVYSETGNIDMDNAIKNGGFGDFMAAAEEYYVMETSWTETGKPLLPVDPTLPITPIPMDSIVMLPLEYLDGELYHVKTENVSEANPGGILIDAEWGQGWPYNYYCGSGNIGIDYYGERNAAGCGPIAAAQVMSYYQYPSSYNGIVFEWNKILSSVYYSDVYPEISDNAMATALLINTVGVAANAAYGSSTSVTMGDITNMFEEMGYDFIGDVPYSSSCIIGSLNASHPVIIGALDEYSRGHMWAIDAFTRESERKTYYYQTLPYDVYRRTDEEISMYVHCNWGWGYDKNISPCWCLSFYETLNADFCYDARILYNVKPEI